MITKDALLTGARFSADGIQTRNKQLKDIMEVVKRDQPITWLLTEYADEPGYILHMAKELTAAGYVFQVCAEWEAEEGETIPPDVPFMTIRGDWTRYPTANVMALGAVDACALLVELGLPVRFVECGPATTIKQYIDEQGLG